MIYYSQLESLCSAPRSLPQTVLPFSTFKLIRRQLRLIYESHYVFLAIATIVTSIAIACVSLTFHGYWRLRRKFSMSPLKIVTAFNAPMPRGAESNADAKTLLNEVGGQPVNYGAV